MPVKKHDNKKNAPVEVRDSALVPKKEESGKRRPIQDPNLQPHRKERVNALATVGKKKKPK